MSQSQRSQTLHRFSTDTKTRILLISLKAGGVGLNLTAASYLFLLDPWWNPAVEDQAIDRVHRLGQIHPVKVIFNTASPPSHVHLVHFMIFCYVILLYLDYANGLSRHSRGKADCTSS